MSGPYSLREVVAETGITMWALRQGLANGTFAHIDAGTGQQRKHRKLNQEQLEAVRRSVTREAAPTADDVEQDAMARAIEATRANLARSRSRSSRRVA